MFEAFVKLFDNWFGFMSHRALKFEIELGRYLQAFSFPPLSARPAQWFQYTTIRE
jgi:hypothetical protein